MASRHGHCAVVIGASLTGLLAARVLAEHFDQVLLVERDDLGCGAALRKGVPQGAHVHGVWPRGLGLIEALLPGVQAALLDAGACRGDVAAAMSWHHHGGLKSRAPVGIEVTLASRPCLEQQVRLRVLRHPAVQLMDGWQVQSLISEGRQGRITGVRLRRVDALAGGGADLPLMADWVIDASGRGAHALRWLGALGLPLPPESQVQADVCYATQVIERRGAPDTIGHIVFPTLPHTRRGAAAFAVEGQRWLVTLIGVMGEQPPADAAGFAAYARSLPHAAVADLLDGARGLGPAARLRYPASLRRHYERLRAPPPGLLVLGDALASFNPVYGQGITAAALQVQALRECLAAAVPGALQARQVYRAAARAIDAPWQMATTEDLREPSAQGHRPWYLGPLHAALGHVHRAAQVDAEVCRRFFAVAGLQQPPATLFTPAMLWRLARA